ncbi:MAG: IS3 family transposase [Alphaproteobacteria bacterium]|nr:IS3 family transposase [Alphaproteobacteria bacterium]
MTVNQAFYPVGTMARVLGVSRSGFYAWRVRSPSARSIADGDLTRRIRRIHDASRQTYGAPRIHADLAEAGVCVGRKRTIRLMKAAGLAGVSRRRSPSATIWDERVRPACDLVDRNFKADRPNRDYPEFCALTWYLL